MAIGQRNDFASDRINRVSIQFPGLTDGSISNTNVVTSASMFWKISQDKSSNARTLRVYRFKRDVVISQNTWNAWKSGSNFDTPGGFGANDCEQTDIGSVDLSDSESVNSWIEIPLSPTAMTEIVQGTWTTPTFLLKMDAENRDAYSYYSSNHATSTNRPYIVVEHGPVETSNIKKAAGVVRASIKKIGGVPIASVKKLSGVE